MKSICVVVAPRVGAWIEIAFLYFTPSYLLQSHPVWVRGLKSAVKIHELCSFLVAPRVGAWIEISTHRPFVNIFIVAPRVGAWIEILILNCLYFIISSRTPCGCVD